MQGLIFNIQKFSIQDGPGIRTTVFMKGCPMVCLWCSNPEGMSAAPEIMTFDQKCIGCRSCAAVCPPGFNDSEANMKRTAELAGRINAEKISLLPHHDWGKEKYARLGKKFSFDGTESLTEDSKIVIKCKEILESYNLKIEIGV